MEDVHQSNGYGEFVKLRERFQADGMDEETAQKAVMNVMNWCSEMASHASRSYKPMAERFLHELEREELPISPPKGDQQQITYADVEPHMVDRKKTKPPKAAPISF